MVQYFHRSRFCHSIRFRVFPHTHTVFLLFPLKPFLFWFWCYMFHNENYFVVRNPFSTVWGFSFCVFFLPDTILYPFMLVNKTETTMYKTLCERKVLLAMKFCMVANVNRFKNCLLQKKQTDIIVIEWILNIRRPSYCCLAGIRDHIELQNSAFIQYRVYNNQTL